MFTFGLKAKDLSWVSRTTERPTKNFATKKKLQRNHFECASLEIRYFSFVNRIMKNDWWIKNRDSRPKTIIHFYSDYKDKYEHEAEFRGRILWIFIQLLLSNPYLYLHIRLLLCTRWSKTTFFEIFLQWKFVWIYFNYLHSHGNRPIFHTKKKL